MKRIVLLLQTTLERNLIIYSILTCPKTVNVKVSKCRSLPHYLTKCFLYIWLKICWLSQCLDIQCSYCINFLLVIKYFLPFFTFSLNMVWSALPPPPVLKIKEKWSSCSFVYSFWSMGYWVARRVRALRHFNCRG